MKELENNDARGIVRNRNISGLLAVFQRPCRCDLGVSGDVLAHANVIRRLGHQRRRCGVEQKGRYLGAVDHRGRSGGLGRQAEPAEKRDFVANDQFLRKLLGFARVSACVAVDDLDLASAKRVAVLGDIGFKSLPPIVAHDRERPGHRSDDAVFDRLLGKSRLGRDASERRGDKYP